MRFCGAFPRSGSAYWGATLVVVSLIVASAKAQTAPSLDALLTSFRSVSGMELHFREEKRIALMRVPSISEGTLHYARPGRLVRRVTSPSPTVVLIDGDELRMSEGGRIERIDLSSQPLVRSFVDTFSQLLAGDRALLERTYHVAYAPREGARWTMTLTPKSAPLDRFLREIRFEGQGTALERMVMSEANGDLTTTVFSSVDTTRRFSAEESSRIFSLSL